MRVYHRRKWDVTHSLTPSISLKHQPHQFNIPQLPVKKTITHKSSNNNQSPFNATHHRSRKHRLAQQRSTQIQITNRRLYQKIRKIMQKGHSSQKKLENQSQIEQEHNNTYSQFLNTSIKPLSLPQISTSNSNANNLQISRTTQSELYNILDHRSKYAQKYFADLAATHQLYKNIKSVQMGNFVCFGWKIKALLLDDGKFLILNGIKGKKQVTKKYIYDKVKEKIKNCSEGLDGWVSEKFEFEI